jgi:hypothetical protein
MLSSIKFLKAVLTMFDLNINQGCDFSIILKIKDNSGTPVNLTGFSFASQAKLKFNQPLPDFTFAFTLANQVTNPGELEMSLAAADTDSLYLTECTSYHYDLEMTNTQNKIERIMSGHANVSPEVTR